ncbi:MAG: excalibur calcium-binding domain-containing protein [Alphaproteobacteria bacterium]|nr:excalibur calcium-binding domain-containing protein [Alphaproteobacteria bacterium]
MTTLRQQIMIKRTLRNLRTWAPPISIGVIIGVLVYFAFEKLDEQPAQTHAAEISSRPVQRSTRIQHSSRLAAASIEQESVRYEPARYEPTKREQRRREPVVSTSYQQRPYRNCTEARAAGADPVLAGTPGYGEHLDGDHDGIGCEPYYH